METAIKKAIEGGYRGEYIYQNTAGEWCFNEDHTFLQHKLLLDPLFWQALGKAEGWRDNWYDIEYDDDGAIGIDGWQYQWHKFIDHLAEGKNINSFFEDLLAN